MAPRRSVLLAGAVIISVFFLALFRHSLDFGSSVTSADGEVAFLWSAPSSSQRRLAAREVVLGGSVSFSAAGVETDQVKIALTLALAKAYHVPIESVKVRVVRYRYRRRLRRLGGYWSPTYTVTLVAGDAGGDLTKAAAKIEAAAERISRSPSDFGSQLRQQLVDAGADTSLERSFRMRHFSPLIEIPPAPLVPGARQSLRRAPPPPPSREMPSSSPSPAPVPQPAEKRSDGPSAILASRFAKAWTPSPTDHMTKAFAAPTPEPTVGPTRKFPKPSPKPTSEPTRAPPAKKLKQQTPEPTREHSEQSKVFAPEATPEPTLAPKGTSMKPSSSYSPTSRAQTPTPQVTQEPSQAKSSSSTQLTPKPTERTDTPTKSSDTRTPEPSQEPTEKTQKTTPTPSADPTSAPTKSSKTHTFEPAHASKNKSLTPTSIATPKSQSARAQASENPTPAPSQAPTNISGMISPQSSAEPTLAPTKMSRKPTPEPTVAPTFDLAASLERNDANATLAAATARAGQAGAAVPVVAVAAASQVQNRSTPARHHDDAAAPNGPSQVFEIPFDNSSELEIDTGPDDHDNSSELENDTALGQPSDHPREEVIPAAINASNVSAADLVKVIHAAFPNTASAGGVQDALAGSTGLLTPQQNKSSMNVWVCVDPPGQGGSPKARCESGNAKDDLYEYTYDFYGKAPGPEAVCGVGCACCRHKFESAALARHFASLAAGHRHFGESVVAAASPRSDGDGSDNSSAKFVRAASRGQLTQEQAETYAEDAMGMDANQTALHSGTSGTQTVNMSSGLHLATPLASGVIAPGARSRNATKAFGVPSDLMSTASPQDVGCCFMFGYGAMMSPCCLEVETLAEDECLDAEAPENGFIGGGHGWRRECPSSAEEAADWIRADRQQRLASTSTKTTTALAVAADAEGKLGDECCPPLAGPDCIAGVQLPECDEGLRCVFRGEEIGPPRCEASTSAQALAHGGTPTAAEGSAHGATTTAAAGSAHGATTTAATTWAHAATTTKASATSPARRVATTTVATSESPMLLVPGPPAANVTVAAGQLPLTEFPTTPAPNTVQVTGWISFTAAGVSSYQVQQATQAALETALRLSAGSVHVQMAGQGRVLISERRMTDSWNPTYIAVVQQARLPEAMSAASAFEEDPKAFASLLRAQLLAHGANQIQLDSSLEVTNFGHLTEVAALNSTKPAGEGAMERMAHHVYKRLMVDTEVHGQLHLFVDAGIALLMCIGCSMCLHCCGCCRRRNRTTADGQYHAVGGDEKDEEPPYVVCVCFGKTFRFC